MDIPPGLWWHHMVLLYSNLSFALLICLVIMKRITCYGMLSLVMFVGLVTGCADNKGLTVTGKVTVDGAPLSQGEVSYHSGTGAGGNAVVLTASVDAQGDYTMVAPPGTYKVTVFAEEPRSSEGADAYAMPKYLVAAPFRNPDTTPLTVDVKTGAAEGAYDFDVTKK